MAVATRPYPATADDHPSATPPPGTRPFKTPEFRDLLLRVAGRGGVVNSNALGLWFKSISGRVVQGGQLHVRLDPKRGNKYSLRFNAGAIDPDDWHFAHAAE